MDDTQFSVGSIYESISDALATARTKARIGDMEEANSILHSAQMDFNRFRNVLEVYPGFNALEYALSITHDTLIRTEEVGNGGTGSRG